MLVYKNIFTLSWHVQRYVSRLFMSICLLKCFTMQFISYTKSDTAYTFIGKDGEKVIVPIGDVILVDDNSGAISVKNTASRCVLGYILK